MIKPAYILAARAISAQDSFRENNLPEELADAVNNTLVYQQPDYTKYFTIMQLRRMGRITRIGMVAAIECLADAGIKKPAAIITGTSKGSVGDTEKFISSIQEFDEGTLNPTPFIQSTYNSLNGLISLHHDTSCYNTTFVHRGHSLELAFLDALLLFAEGGANNALVGSFEEITPEHFIIRQKLGFWKNESVSCKDLLASNTEGTIAGEGSFFFVLAQDATGAMAKLSALKTLLDPTEAELHDAIASLLSAHLLEYQDIDILYNGINGDSRFVATYEFVASLFGQNTTVLGFKQACGEFDTAAGFAVWHAALTLRDQRLHRSLTLRKGAGKQIRNILIYNNFNGRQHAIYLLQQA